MDPSNALLLPSLETPADSLGSPGLLLPSIETNALLLPDLDDENNVEVHSLTALFTLSSSIGFSTLYTIPPL